MSRNIFTFELKEKPDALNNFWIIDYDQYEYIRSIFDVYCTTTWPDDYEHVKQKLEAAKEKWILSPRQIALLYQLALLFLNFETNKKQIAEFFKYLSPV